MTTCFKVHTSSGRLFSVSVGQTLLDAAEKSGVIMPYSCRTGRCSSCKVKVLSGDSHALQPERGLTAEERSAGWVLGCVCIPDADMHIEVEDLGDVVVPVPKIMPCRISTIERLGVDVVRVVLRTPPATPLQWLAGQYIDVIGPEGVRRSYSLANACLAHNEIELHVRQVSGGVMSQYWFDTAQPNDLLRLHGPLGTSFLRDVSGKDIIFMATGTGLAPVKAMLEELVANGRLASARSVHVFWGGRTTEDLYWTLDLPAIVNYIPVLSRATDGWSGETGYVQDACLKRIKVFTQAQVYACGSENMITSARQVLCAAGLAERNFHADAFVSSSN